MNLNKEKIIKHALNISIVIPCYNEDEVLNETTSQLNVILNSLIERKVITKTSKVYFIDDGSTDKTWSLIEKLSIKHENIHGLKLSRNYGHQNALLAGLMSADGDVVVSIDADLQDDLAAIEKMIDLYTYGYEIVYGVRESRSTDYFFKKLTAELYYKLLLLMGVEIIFNHADYRLLSRKAINSLRDFKEVNIFLRGIIPKLGYQHAVVYYNRSKRYAG